MLEILLVIFIGRKFYELADKHGRNKWGFGVLGVVSTYAILTLVSFLGAILIAMFRPEWLYSMNDLVFVIICIPFALLGVWGLYTGLKKSWEKRQKIRNPMMVF